MKFIIQITDDSYNSNPTDSLEIIPWDCDKYLELKISGEDRQISIKTDDLRKILKALESKS